MESQLNDGGGVVVVVVEVVVVEVDVVVDVVVVVVGVVVVGVVPPPSGGHPVTIPPSAIIPANRRILEFKVRMPPNLRNARRRGIGENHTKRRAHGRLDVRRPATPKTPGVQLRSRTACA